MSKRWSVLNHSKIRDYVRLFKQGTLGKQEFRLLCVLHGMRIVKATRFAEKLEFHVQLYSQVPF